MDNLEKIFAAFNVEPAEYINRYSCACPIHKGDNPTAFSIYKESGAWKCFTGGCHEKYGGGVSGLVRGLLTTKLGRSVTSQEVNQCLQEICGGNFKINKDAINYVFFLKDDKKDLPKVKREHVRKRLQIPAQYYVGRGYSPEILDRYDVGLCVNQSSNFHNRCVVPIYDDAYEYAIGFTGRDVTNKSNLKWLHNAFERNKSLYNSWFAKQHIQKTGTCVLVESPGNIWRLEEAGIHCGLAIFGTELSFEQTRLLSQYGTMNLVLMMDNGEAGKNATARIVKKLKGLYNIVIPKIDYEDLGECPIAHIQDRVLPAIHDLSA